jgi:hypothetical protein
MFRRMSNLEMKTIYPAHTNTFILSQYILYYYSTICTILVQQYKLYYNSTICTIIVCCMICIHNHQNKHRTICLHMSPPMLSLTIDVLVMVCHGMQPAYSVHPDFISLQTLKHRQLYHHHSFCHHPKANVLD